MGRMKHTAELIGALVLLANAGSFVALAAPHANTPHASAQMAPTDTPLTVAGAPAPTPTNTPKSTTHTASSPQLVSASTTSPTPTPTPAPTPTPTPAPTPTSTPAPSWHTVLTVSGSTAQSLGSFPVDGPVKVDYTCTAGTGLQFSWSNPDGAAFTMGTGDCTSSTTSGTLNAGQPTGSSGWSWSVGPLDSNGIGPWSATVEEYY